MGWLFNSYLLLLLFNILNVVAFAAIVCVAVVNIVRQSSPTNLIIYYAYTGILSLALLLSEFRAPLLLNSQARFLFTYTGRGLLLTFFGCIVYADKIYNLVACVYVVTLGVLYLVIAWVPLVPLQHGIVYNWYKLRHPEEEDTGSEITELVNEDTYMMSPTKDPYYQQQQQQQQLPPNNDTAADHVSTPLVAAYPQSINIPPSFSCPDNAASTTQYTNNESFIYGVSAEPRQLSTTGDPYLDSIINNPQLAKEMMMDDEEQNSAISVRDVKPLSSTPHRPLPPRPYTADMHANVTISPPMPYHVYAPSSRKPLVENISRVSRALENEKL